MIIVLGNNRASGGVGGAMVEGPPASAGDAGSIPGLGRSSRK